MRLKEIKSISGKIELLTGLHIGAGIEATQIGGVDNPIIRLPKNRNPYIPGSSLKGKLRSLLELATDKVEPDGKPHVYKDSCQAEHCPICHLFGAAANQGAPIGPGRLIVRDCTIDDNVGDNKRIKDESPGLPYSEEKTEISINRIKSAVETGLRKTERVPAGVIFDLDMSLRVFDCDDDKLLDTLLYGMSLLEKDTLGGSGSRGYGKIKFKDLQIDGKELNLPEV